MSEAVGSESISEDFSPLEDELEFSDIVTFFFECRGKGASLSQRDLQVLSSWEQRNVSVKETLEKMKQIREKCDHFNEEFPGTLKSLEWKLRKG